MLFPRHPRPLIPTRAIASLLVQQRRDGAGPLDRDVLIVETTPPAAAPAPPAKPDDSAGS